MSETKEAGALSDHVEATLNYILDDGTRIVTTTVTAEGHEIRSGGTIDPRPITLHNGRRHAEKFSLEREGFRFMRHETAVADFYDEDEIRRIYYPEVETLVRKESGAKRVLIFDHVLRSSDGGPKDSGKFANIQRPINGVHNDFTEWSAARRLRELLPDEEDVQDRRFAIIQIWQPISCPVETDPFAIADAQSLSPDDLVISERRNRGRVSQTYGLTYSPAHRWFWFPRMRPDEALVFKAYDSRKDGRARWTAHTAFKDPTSSAKPKPRESIETRTLALF